MASEIPPFRRGLTPVEHALLPYIEEADQKNPEVHQHLPETKVLQIAQDNGPRIDENCFYVEQNEQHSYQVELHREALPGVSDRRHAAFIGRKFSSGGFPLPDQPRKRDNCDRDPASHKNMDEKREVASEVIVGHRKTYI